MAQERSAFRNVIRSQDVATAMPVDEYLAEIDAFIDAHNPYRINKVIAAIGNGSASLDVVKRYATELYYLGLWMTPELALLIANAPDSYALTMNDSEHYAHWCQNFADETGYLRDPNHVQMKVDHCHQLGITDEELRAYVPMPETIGSIYTLLYYCRRSYEEGLAAFGYARERVAGMSGYAQTVYTGLSKYYGIKAKNFEVHAYAETEHGDKALDLIRKVVLTADTQRRCRQAIQHTILTNEWRAHAMNRWLEG
ncbi:MAG TPA: iron-containing redox enzyme family protein [Candidatus Acidoferrales bacterium]|nr:iron-containing redox enzyme family protein [Candidatus Acidoferrales bacterium]